MHRRTLLKSLGLATAAAPLSSKSAWTQAFPTTVGPDALFNQLGYRPGDAKIASLRGAAPGQNTFRIRTAADSKVVFEGALAAPQVDAASGDRLQIADFSTLRERGSYRLEFAGQGTGAFAVGEDVYGEALRLVVRGFTGQRCGCAVDLGDGYRHPACHLSGAFGASSGRHGDLPNHGGWHDAGDYGRYVVNSGISCGTLLWAWEMYPGALKNLRLDVPRQHGDLPEYLEEILWNLQWMLQMQDTDGGVFHKQTSNQFCAFIMPQDDHLTSNVIGIGTTPFKSTAATADFAAVMAIAARCFQPFDAALAAKLLLAARSAWTWAVAHPGIVFRNPPGVSTGEYGDPKVSDEVLWASAELWRTTGEAPYEQAFQAGLPANLAELRIEAPSWGGVASMACWTYVLARQMVTGRGKAIREAIRTRTHEAARHLTEVAHGNGYGNTLAAEDYTWGSNGVAGNQSLLLAVAQQIGHDGEFRPAALANLHYLLGRNCFGVSWVTQLGTRPYMHPHHRPSAADGIAAPWPGLLSGGPNRHGGDKVADALPKGPPMRMWVDNQDAYSLNEIAINWNAPLVFLLAFANSSAS